MTMRAKRYQTSAALPYFYAPHHHFAFLISNFSFKRDFQTESKDEPPQGRTPKFESRNRDSSIPFLWKGNARRARGWTRERKAPSQPPPLRGTSFQRKEGKDRAQVSPYLYSAVLLIFMRRTNPFEPVEPTEPAEPLSHTIKGRKVPEVKFESRDE